MSDLPTWIDLTEDQRRRLENLASSHGIMLKDHPVSKLGFILPDEGEAHCIAIEMFTISRAIMLEGSE